MNFNFNHKPEYQLHQGLITEMIRLYGTAVNFVFMDKIQEYGGEVFGDFTTMKTSKGFGDSMEYVVHVLLADTESYNPGLALAFNNFGLINDDTIQVFVPIQELNFLSEDGKTVHPKEIVGNCLVFPNGKVLEITDCQLHVEGINNQFVYSDFASVYKFSLKSYNFDRTAVDLVKSNKGAIEASESKTIDEFFNKQDIRAANIKAAAEAEILSVEDFKEVSKPQTTVYDVFGDTQVTTNGKAS